MKFLAAMLKFFLVLLGAALLLAGLTLLCWWLRWPMFTGVFILLALLGLFLLAIAGRRLLRWRDKHRFVHGVLSERKEAFPTGRQIAGNTLKEAWNLGFKGMGMGKSRHLVLDCTGGSSLFDALSAKTPDGAGTSPLCWRNFSSLTLLHLVGDFDAADTGAAPQHWKEVLALLAGDGKKLSLQGILLLFSFSELERNSFDDLRHKGFALRSRLRELMLCLDRNLPVYLVAEGLGQIPGSADLLGRLPGKVLEETLGCLFPGGVVEFPGRKAADAAARSLRQALNETLADGERLAGDELLCLERIHNAGPKLDSLLDALTLEQSAPEPLRLKAVLLCQARLSAQRLSAPGQETGEVQNVRGPAFVRALVSRILPLGRHEAWPLNGRFSGRGSLKALLMGAWLLLLLSVCGLFAANVIYQKRALATLPAPFTQRLDPPLIAQLYTHMNYIQNLERAGAMWLLPTFGLNILGRVEAEEKSLYAQRVYEALLGPVLLDIRAAMADGVPGGEKQTAAVNELLWLCDAVSDCLEFGKADSRKVFFPLTSLTDRNWTTANGEIIRNALNWTPNRKQLELLSSDLRALVVLNIGRKEGNLLVTMRDIFDANHPENQICLSQYWTHLPRGDSQDMCIPPSFTAAGYAALGDQMDDLREVSGESPDVTQALQVYKSEFFSRYAELWTDFIERFSERGESIEQVDVYEDLSSLVSVRNLPHTRLLQRLATELAPLAHADASPDWLPDARLLGVMIRIALDVHDKKEAPSWHGLLGSSILNADDTLRQLWSMADSPAMLRAVYQSVRSLTLFFNDTRELLQTTAVPTASLALASLHFSGKDAEGVQKSLFTAMEKDLGEALAVGRSGGMNPPAALLRGIQGFMENSVIVQAAHVLQKEWERNVLSGPEHLYGGEDTERLYGKDGVVPTFVTDTLTPFLHRTESGVAAGKWKHHSFPFTNDFLTFLTHMEINSMAAPVQNKYMVMLRSLPTKVNSDAAERPDSTTLTLQCNSGAQRLVNRNYPHNESFAFAPDECGTATLTVAFPSFELRQEYENFTAFVENFQYGERIFTADDFPNKKSVMDSARISFVSVRIHADNTAAFLRILTRQALQLPDRITFAR